MGTELKGINFILEPQKIHFTQTKTGILSMTLKNGETYTKVYPVCLFPLSMPDYFISICDSKGKEIGVIENLKKLSHQQQSMIREELKLRYFIPIIRDVAGIKSEYGLYKWETDTDWGHKTFFVVGRNENINVIEGHRLIITDIENCRYDIPNYTKLPDKAIIELEKIL
jgi:hypothetical protein